MYLSGRGTSFLICYTSEKRAQKGFGDFSYDCAKMGDILNNMFNKESLTGLAFNPGKEAMVLIPKECLKLMMPGSKPKLPFFAIHCMRRKNKEALYTESLSKGMGKRGLPGIGNIRKGYIGTAVYRHFGSL